MIEDEDRRAPEEPMIEDEDGDETKNKQKEPMTEDENEMKKRLEEEPPFKVELPSFVLIALEKFHKRRKEERQRREEEELRWRSTPQPAQVTVNGDRPSPKLVELSDSLPKPLEADEKLAQQHPEPCPPPPRQSTGWRQTTGRNIKHMLPGYKLPDDAKEELERYNKQVKESGGYDIDKICNRHLAHRHMIRPVNQVFFDLFVDSALLAIDHANKSNEYPGELKLVRVTKLNQVFYGYLVQYFTLEARCSADGKKRVYQAKVVRESTSKARVLEFKLKHKSSRNEQKGSSEAAELRRSERSTHGKRLQERYHDEYCHTKDKSSKNWRTAVKRREADPFIHRQGTSTGDVSTGISSDL